jgi:hypothetical protein
MIVGSNLTLAATRYEKDPTRGLFTVRVFEGSQAAVQGLQAQLSPDEAWAIDDADKPLYRITVRTPDDASQSATDALVTEWELLGNLVQKDILGHPSFQTVSAALVAQIKSAIDSSDLPSITDDTAFKLYLLLSREQNQYNDVEYVLRKSITVSRRYQTKVAFANLLELHTSAQVIDAEQIPSDIVFSIALIPGLADVGYAGSVTFKHRWLKMPPQVHSKFGSKSTITQEYWLNLWCTDLYALA